jgi:hypothetical protein
LLAGQQGMRLLMADARTDVAKTMAVIASGPMLPDRQITR